MVRPATRNQLAARIFNNALWPVHYDTTLVDSLQRRTKNIADLSSSQVFEGVIEQVHADMVRIIGRSFSLGEIKVRIDTIRRRFYQFMVFTTVPGVNFNRMTNQLRISPEYTSTLSGESMIRRYFRSHGFPYYETCNEVFEFKNAAAINFEGVVGYNPLEPIEIEDSDNSQNEIVAYQGNDMEENSVNNNIGVQGEVNDTNAIVVYEGNPENNNLEDEAQTNNYIAMDNEEDDFDPMDEHRYGWGSGYSSSGYHSSDSQNTWSR